MPLRLVFLAASFLAVAVPSQASVTDLLASAVQKFVEQEDDWAYTQVYRRADKPHAPTIARFDPSRPTGEQWTLLQLRGRKPSLNEAARWCEKREKQVNQSDARAAAELLDIPLARVCGEEGRIVRYEVPLKNVTVGRIPAGNFVVYADVDRDACTLQRFRIHLREAVRIFGGIAEIQSAQGEVEFARGDTPGITRPARIIAQGTGQALFKKVNRAAEIVYTDHRRVKG